MLEPLLPKEARTGRPPLWPRRRLIDGTRFRVRTGVPWRAIPVEYRPWNEPADPHSAPVPGRPERRDRLGPGRRLHGLPRSSARGRGPQAGCLVSDRAGRASVPIACGPTRPPPPARIAPRSCPGDHAVVTCQGLLSQVISRIRGHGSEQMVVLHAFPAQ
ncbi:transposase [Streptomyces zaomyceticus]|uniref:transposase n=1 Tax=Streptomyces zaomyceticus TaxID=68286 RepID=UPI00365B3023